MIQGPLTLNWGRRKFGLLPRIENGELSADSPPNLERIRLWMDCAIGIEGADQHVFIKLYTHGLQEENMQMFFDDGGFDRLFTDLEREIRDVEGYELHYQTAWEMYQQVRALCTGDGEPASAV